MKTNLEFNRITLLHERALAAAQDEKAATFRLLECLHDIDCTRAYLDLGFSSLFTYVHEALGYSESQAYERVSAMRLAFKVKEVGEQLRTGAVSMSALARIAVHAKRECPKSFDEQKIIQWTRQAAGQSVRSVEKFLAAEATVAPSARATAREVVRPVAPNATEIRITVESDFETLLQEARELDADPSMRVADVLKKALRVYVADRRKKKGAVSADGQIGSHADVDSTLRTSEVKVGSPSLGSVPRLGLESTPTPTPTGRPSQNPLQNSPQNQSMLAPNTSPAHKNPKAITKKTKLALWRNSGGRCQYVSPLTQKRCTERHAIHIDHVTPKYYGGSNHPENLRHLCAAHNQAAAREWGVSR